MIRAILLFLLALVGCGGSSIVNCAPASSVPCAPTDARGIGCNLSDGADGKPIVAVRCTGGDASPGCFPDEHEACVADCSAGGARACQ